MPVHTGSAAGPPNRLDRTTMTSETGSLPSSRGRTSPSQGGPEDHEVHLDPREIAVQVEGVSKVYPGTRALDGVNVTLRAGEIHGLCGGNGSGKSTLIKILCGVVDGDEGSVRFGERGVDVSDLTATLSHELGVRVVHQDLGIFPDLSVAENIMLGSDYPTTATGRVRWKEVRKTVRSLI